MKLRILSIGQHLEHPSITNSNLQSAHAFSDYDAVVIDPQTFFQLWDSAVPLGNYSARRTHKVTDKGFGERVLDVISRRRGEAAQILSVGGIIICFVKFEATVDRLEYDNGEKRQKISIYDWIPYKDSTPIVNESVGTQMKLLDKHPFFQYFNAYSGSLSYKGIIRVQTRDKIVLATNKADLPLALEVKVGTGKILFLPQQTSNSTKLDGAIMVDCIRNVLHRKGEIDSPPWIDNYNVPGENKHQDEINTLNTQIQQLTSKRDKLVKEQEDIVEYKGLFYETGKYGLEPIVRRAFRLIGFEVPDPDEYEEEYDVILKLDVEWVAIAECEGSEEQVNLRKYRQLLDYIQGELTSKGRELKGILVGNGYRLTKPSERVEQFTSHAIRGAKSQQYCVLPTTELFRIVCAVLNDMENEARKKQFRDSILNTVGLYKVAD